jgi:hypothetical protein
MNWSGALDGLDIPGSAIRPPAIRTPMTASTLANSLPQSVAQAWTHPKPLLHFANIEEKP